MGTSQLKLTRVTKLRAYYLDIKDPKDSIMYFDTLMTDPYTIETDFAMKIKSK